MLPLAVRTSAVSTSARIVLNGFEHPPPSRDVVPRDWIPPWAYTAPFGHTQAKVRSRSGGVVAFVTRSNARKWDDEAGVFGALRLALTMRDLQLQVFNESRHTSRDFESVVGVVGVHGSAFGNIHVCAPGTPVIEVIGRLVPASWANFASGLRLEYFAYVAEQYPGPWGFHRASNRSNVGVNISNFAAFVGGAFDMLRQRDMYG